MEGNDKAVLSAISINLKDLRKSHNQLLVDHDSLKSDYLLVSKEKIVLSSQIESLKKQIAAGPDKVSKAKAKAKVE